MMAACLVFEYRMLVLSGSSYISFVFNSNSASN